MITAIGRGEYENDYVDQQAVEALEIDSAGRQSHRRDHASGRAMLRMGDGKPAADARGTEFFASQNSGDNFFFVIPLDLSVQRQADDNLSDGFFFRRRLQLWQVDFAPQRSQAVLESHFAKPCQAPAMRARRVARRR